VEVTSTNTPPDSPEEPQTAATRSSASEGRTAPGRALGSRVARLVVLGVVVTLSILFLFLLPDLLGGIPLEIKIFITHPAWPIAFAAALLVFGPSRLAAAVPRRYRDRLVALADRARRTPQAAFLQRALSPRTEGRPARVEGFAAWALGRPATVALGACSALMVLTWAPHYLTWPWWADADQFAVAALSWHAGLVPYRDQADFDFPGPIYLFYVLGAAFGWDRTAPFYAADAAMLAGLGVALAAWGRRLFGRALPGLVAYLPFLAYYLGLGYSLVAQRDWHGPLFAILALMALEAWPGRVGRLASAMAMAVALLYRPHEVLFLPAVASALLEGCGGDDSWRRRARLLVEWSVALAACLALVFGPLIVAGAIDDFVRALRIARYGGTYNRATWMSFIWELRRHFQDPRTVGSLAAGVLTAVAGPAALRGPSRTWSLALLGILFYKPLSPIAFEYLDQPMVLVRSIALAPPIAWLLATGRLSALLRLAAVVAVVALGVSRVPEYCSASRSLRALGPLFRGEDPIDPPSGSGRTFRALGKRPPPFRWDEYRSLLAYLRSSISPRTRVANLLWAFPYPVINGPAGRLTPFPAAGGYLHLLLVEPGLEARYVEALERTPDSVVVWNPRHGNPRFPLLVKAVRRLYRPEVRFGSLEVWRHVASPRTPAEGPSRSIQHP
jgi:hypothetical protein